MLRKDCLRLLLLAILLPSAKFYTEEETFFGGRNLTVCCSDEDPFYRPWLDICRRGIDGYEPSSKFPWIQYSTNSLTHDLRACPEGHVSNSSKEFHLFDNGTLQVNVSDVELTLQPGEFCLNEILTEDSSSVGPQWIARFCIPDENYCGPETNCIRKCCPIGMVFNKTGRFCQQFDFINVTEYIPESFHLRGGLGPHCHDEGRNVLDKENFKILEDGRLIDTDSYNIYMDGEERITKEFCVEHFLLDDGQASIVNLKVMKCFPKTPQLEEKDNKIMQVYPYFHIASSVFVLITLGVYAVLPDLQNIHGVSIMCYLTSLGLLYILLSSIRLSEMTRGLFCTFIALTTHFSSLAAFTWLNVVCFDVFDTLKGMHHAAMRGNNSNRHRLGGRFVYYSLYGWGVPLAIVGIGQVFDNIKNLPSYIIKPNLGVWTCWFYKGNQGAIWLYLYGPMAILIASNVVLFIFTVIHLQRSSNDTAIVGRKNQAKQKFKIIVSLFFIMGVSWITEMITFALNVPFEITVVPDILNILTGVYVFIIFVWKPSVWNLLKKKFPFLKHLNAISNIFNCKLMRRNLNIRQNKSPGDERNNSQSSSGFSNDSTQSSNVRSYPNSQSSAL